MSETQNLIEAIGKLPNHTVYPSRTGHAVMIVHQRSETRCTQTSVWLGRKNTDQKLLEILEKGGL